MQHEPIEIKHNTRAFVFIDTRPGKEKDLMEKLLKYDEVKEVHLITGKNDVLAILEVKRDILIPSATNVFHFLEKIRKEGDVNDTETLVPLYSKTKWTESA